MQNSPHTVDEFARTLGLEWGEDDLLVGKIQGFPVGLKFISPEGGVVLLFQIRHWLAENAPESKVVVYDKATTQLVTDKKIQIEFEDRLVWLTIVDLGESFGPESVKTVLDSVLQGFAKAGFIGDTNLCHYCRKEKTDKLSVSGGKVAQICPTCLDERLTKYKASAPATQTAEAVPIVLMTPLASFAGAILWAIFFAVITLMFETAEEVYVPQLMIVLVMVCVGLLTGGPVGFIIKLNRRRGGAVSAAAAILFSSLAVLAGELFFLVWLIYHEFRVVSFRAALQVMPNYYLHNDPMYIAFKVLAGVICVVVAYRSRSREKLV